MAKNLASVKMYSSPAAKPRVTPPAPDSTYFYTAGRILSYFPQINRNGITFFREDCKALANTLLASTADIQHVKPGYPVADPLKVTLKNTIFSAISAVEEHEEGIDIVCKAEREVAKAMGFTEEDFGPGGKFGSYSQECDYNPAESAWIVVDKNEPTKILKEVAYADGLAMGFKISHVGADGDWKYHLVDGNPVYVRIKPLAFSGVGHVITPADESAEIYKLAASLDSCRQLAGFYPGMDDIGPIPHDMVAGAGPSADLQPFAFDFLEHPDLRTASLDKFSDKDQEDAKAPDDHFAAVYSDFDYGNTTDGKPTSSKKRLFRIKDDKGNLDRKRLVVAYHGLAGLRGNVHLAQNLPSAVRAHALDLVRQGLKQTKPKTSKETSSQVELNQEIEALKAKEKELSGAKDAAEKELATLKSQIKDLEDAQAKALSAKDEEIKALKDEVAGYQAKELAAKRLSELEAVLPYSDEEKKAESFGEFTKSLASLTDDGMKIAILTRQLEASKKTAVAAKEVSSANGGKVVTDPTGVFDVAKAVASVEGEDKPKTAVGFLI
jgi:hypothetical protein